MNTKEIQDRMTELMEPIDRQILMCDTSEDVLMFASIMMSTAKQMMVSNLGEENTKELMKGFFD